MKWVEWVLLITSDTLAQLFIKAGAHGLQLDSRILVGYGFVVLSFLIWMRILKTLKLSIALSAASANYITVALGSHYVFGEPLGFKLLVGCALVALGVFWLGVIEARR